MPAVAVPVAITLRRCCGLEIGLLRYLSGRQAMGRGEPAPVAAKLQKAVMIERGAGELEAEAEAETEGAAETQRACPNRARAPSCLAPLHCSPPAMASQQLPGLERTGTQPRERRHASGRVAARPCRPARGAMGGMKLPRAILFDLDATTLVAFGPAKS